MKYLVWLISAINIYLGIHCLLNALHILQNSKYSQGATALYAILFLGMGIGGFYFSIAGSNQKLALLISIGPWILALLFLLFTLLTSDYK